MFSVYSDSSEYTNWITNRSMSSSSLQYEQHQYFHHPSKKPYNDFSQLVEYDENPDLHNQVSPSPSIIPVSSESIIMNGISTISSVIDDSDSSTTFVSKPISGLNSSWLEDNFWAVFDEEYLRHGLGWTIALLITYTLIFIIGIIGNLMVILVVIKRQQMRTVTNMFIVNLAVADLFVIVFCVPATLLSNVFTPWILGSIMCKGVAYVQGVSVCASAYSLAAISLDRCKAIFRPLERPCGLSKPQALFTICFIWVVALLLTIPWAVYFNVVVAEKDELLYCIETWENETHGKIYFLIANLFCCYSLPLILITISNVALWCHVSHRKVPQDSASAATIKKMHRKTRHGVRKMLGIVTLAFLLSWLPLYILVTRVKFTKNISEWESNLLDILLPFAQWLGSMNSSINPVLYAFLNSKFREMFKSLLPKWLPCAGRINQNVVSRTEFAKATTTNKSFVRSPGTPSCSTVFTYKTSSVNSCQSSRRSHFRRNNGALSPRIICNIQKDTLATVVGGETTTSIIQQALLPINANVVGEPTVTDL